MLYVAWKREFPHKRARLVLFRPIKKRSFLISCVFWIFFQYTGSQLCFILFFFSLQQTKQVYKLKKEMSTSTDYIYCPLGHEPYQT